MEQAFYFLTTYDTLCKSMRDNSRGAPARSSRVRGETKQDNLLGGDSLYTRAQQPAAKWRLAQRWAIVGILLFRFLHTVPVKSLFGIIPRTITYLPLPLPIPLLAPFLSSSAASSPLPRDGSVTSAK